MDTALTLASLFEVTVSPVFGYTVLHTESLPSRDQVLTALAGHLRDAPDLLRCARELGDLHASLIPATVDQGHREGVDVFAVLDEIAGVEAAIDSWAAFSVPRSPVGRRHTHSLGEVISHIARTYAHVSWTLRHCVRELHKASEVEQTMHEAWFHLAQVIEGYADLVDDLDAGRVQLPLGWRGVRPPEQVRPA
ncbi:hypothetical protein [Nocardia suismassiliense]|uniref:hypothetical protein n=1 Tax=Nocardia suismassiliense TaxID=2077092 RepID=UPI000D1E4416|nr:hypothetical protein [Nocardia suismassiliense]